MSARAISHVLGQFLVLLAAFMLVPVAIAALNPNDDIEPIAYGCFLTAGAGVMLLICSGRRWSTEQRDVSGREALLLVVLIWIAAGAFGSIPFQFSQHFPTAVDAVFESISGFTTTGASILPEVEVLPMSLQFWRCFSHWLGGLGVVMMMIAVLPLLGVGGAQLYHVQFGGTKSEKLHPRIIETVRALWKIYVALTLAEYILLRMAGMDVFEAACQSFSTMGTGGFSTRTASIGGFQSATIEYIIISFMILASLNFALHYRFWVERRPGTVISDPEFRFHLSVLAGATCVILTTLLLRNKYPVEAGFRSALFQTTSILTCTGFATDDYEQWHPLAQVLLLALMYLGGNTGSTSGGFKTYRIVLMGKVLVRAFRQAVERRGVFAVRVGDSVIPDQTINGVLALIHLGLLVNFGSALLLTMSGVDMLTAISAVASAMFGVGPALGTVGPAENYSHLPPFAKWVLCATMITGRVEFFTALVVFTPTFWRK